jgi:hypothetical protein
MSTLGWAESGWGATQRPSLEHLAGLPGNILSGGCANLQTLARKAPWLIGSTDSAFSMPPRCQQIAQAMLYGGTFTIIAVAASVGRCVASADEAIFETHLPPGTSCLWAPGIIPRMPPRGSGTSPVRFGTEALDCRALNVAALGALLSMERGSRFRSHSSLGRGPPLKPQSSP